MSIPQRKAEQKRPLVPLHLDEDETNNVDPTKKGPTDDKSTDEYVYVVDKIVGRIFEVGKIPNWVRWYGYTEKDYTAEPECHVSSKDTSPYWKRQKHQFDTKIWAQWTHTTKRNDMKNMVGYTNKIRLRSNTYDQEDITRSCSGERTIRRLCGDANKRKENHNWRSIRWSL